jgi:hypothetical protein
MSTELYLFRFAIYEFVLLLPVYHFYAMMDDCPIYPAHPLLPVWRYIFAYIVHTFVYIYICVPLLCNFLASKYMMQYSLLHLNFQCLAEVVIERQSCL